MACTGRGRCCDFNGAEGCRARRAGAPAGGGGAPRQRRRSGPSSHAAAKRLTQQLPHAAWSFTGLSAGVPLQMTARTHTHTHTSVQQKINVLWTARLSKQMPCWLGPVKGMRGADGAKQAQRLQARRGSGGSAEEGKHVAGWRQVAAAVRRVAAAAAAAAARRQRTLCGQHVGRGGDPVHTHAGLLRRQQALGAPAGRQGRAGQGQGMGMGMGSR